MNHFDVLIYLSAEFSYKAAMNTMMRTRTIFSTGALLLLLGLLVSGCVTKPWNEALRIASFKIEAGDGGDGDKVRLPASGREITVSREVLISEEDIIAVDSIPGKEGPMLMFRLKGDPSRNLYRVSGQNIGKRLVLFIDGKAVGERTIDRAIGGGSVAIYVEMPPAELEKTARELKDSTRRIQEHVIRR